MAYYHARANVCRAGVTYAGLAHHPAVLTIGGTDRTSSIMVDDFTITTALDGAPSTCAFSCQGFTPTQWADVTLTMGGALIWGGTLTDVRAVVQKFSSGAVFWQCQAIDWSWLMDRYSRVRLEMAARPANQAIAEILRDFTDGGFQTGYIPMDLGTVGPFSFTGDTVTSALRRITSSVGAYLRMTPRKTLDAFQTLPASNALSIGNGTDIRGVVYESSGAEVRTRTYYAGGGAQTTEPVPAGGATVPVDECAWYTGSQALVGNDVIAYTGRSVASGPGELTGCTGIDREIAQGQVVQVLAQADDAAAQTALATVLGGGRSGVAVGWFNDGRLSQAEVDDRAAADVAFFKAAVPSLSYTTSARYHEPGKTVAVSTTDPVTISGDFTIQQVVMRKFGAIEGNTPSFQYQVSCRVTRRTDVLDLLAS
jgi:hypothetical protein